jgi:nitroreductase
MDILTAIHSRRSIRKFSDKPVSEEDIRVLLDAAMIAPSAGNAQPWQFVVITDKSVLSQVPSIHPFAAMAANASLGILVCGNPKAERYPGFWVQDCSAAIQNILLAALARNLGTVWTGIYPVEKKVTSFRKMFQIPEDIVPLGLVIVGYHLLGDNHLSRYDEEKVHRNVWKA